VLDVCSFLEARQDLVDRWMHDEAAIDAEEAVAMAGARDVPEVPLAIDREASVVSITVRLRRGDSGQDRRIVELADAAQLLAHDGLLEHELVFVTDVLPLASATDTEVWAGRIDPLR
jgi:hypothetical protein